MATLTWQAASGDWFSASGWTPATVPGSGDNAVIAANAHVVVSTAITPPDPAASAGSVATLAPGSNLELDALAALSVGGDFTNAGGVSLDPGPYGWAGANLSIGGTLTNTGLVSMMNGSHPIDSLPATALSAAALVNLATGRIFIVGGTATLAQFTVGSAAGFGSTGTVTGAVNLSGDTLLQFASGQITNIAAGAGLALTGSNAFVADAGSTSSNSALTGLTNNAGEFDIANNATVALAGDLANSGGLALDPGPYGFGGSTLAIAGTLTNTGLVTLMNGSSSGTLPATDLITAALVNDNATGRIFVTGGATELAMLKVGAPAGFGSTGTVTGAVNLSGDALLQFTSGEFTNIASGANLSLTGANAYVADAGSSNSNSALTGLTSNAGSFNIANVANVALAGDFANSGGVALDPGPYGFGGSTLTVAGTLTNTGLVTVTNGASASAGLITSLSAAAFINDNANGRLSVTGAPNSLAAVTLASPAGFGTAGTVTGSVGLSGDALIQFASGQITGIASNAGLSLTGANAFVADAGSITSNSALTGLTSNAGGFNLANTATVMLAGNFANSGGVSLDAGPYGFGGSSLGVAGTLTNTGLLSLTNGAASGTGLVTRISAAALVNDNATGRISLTGAPGSVGVLSVGTIAGFGTTGVLTGSVNLSGDALLQFASGEISTIAANAGLALTGPMAFVADAGSTNSNSALTGLTSNAGGLSIANVATVTIAGNFLNSGGISLDPGPYGFGGSTLSVAGTMTNSGVVSVSDGAAGMTSELVVGGLINSGNIDLIAAPNAASVLRIQGAGTNAGGQIHGVGSVVGSVTNAGSIISLGSLSVSGNIDGTGRLMVGNHATLGLGGSVGNNQTVTFADNAGLLRIDALSGFAATVANFKLGDTIELTATPATGITYTSGVATLTGLVGGLPMQIGTIAMAGLTNPLTLTVDGSSNTFITEAPCFAAGTRIATARGEVAVEDLRIGDLVRSPLDQDAHPIVWIGRREVSCARRARPEQVWPVRIAGGAFGPRQPHTDLFLSPDHAVYVDGVLIPVRHLINGRSIRQVPTDRVTYYHVELPRHGVVLAQGLPAESFLDMKDGTPYAKRAGPRRPRCAASVWEAFACAPLIVTGEVLEAIRETLNRRAAGSTRRASRARGSSAVAV